MRMISLILILFALIPSYAQDKFPETWEMNKLFNVWDKKSNDVSLRSIEYSKCSDSIIENNLFLKQEIDFFTEKPEANSIKDLKVACYRLFLNTSFLTYSEKFNLIFLRQYFVSVPKKTIAGMCLGLIKYYDGVFYGKNNFRGYWNYSFAKSPRKSWNTKFYLKNNLLVNQWYNE